MLAPKIPYILTEAGRYADLMKQGFMKPYKPARAVKVRPTVACCGCENWHKQGLHTLADAAARRVNLARYRANDKKWSGHAGVVRPMEEIIKRT